MAGATRAITNGPPTGAMSQVAVACSTSCLRLIQSPTLTKASASTPTAPIHSNTYTQLCTCLCFMCTVTFCMLCRLWTWKGQHASMKTQIAERQSDKPSETHSQSDRQTDRQADCLVSPAAVRHDFMQMDRRFQSLGHHYQAGSCNCNRFIHNMLNMAESHCKERGRPVLSTEPMYKSQMLQPSPAPFCGSAQTGHQAHRQRA